MINISEINEYGFNKSILIAIPTQKYIETDTITSLFNMQRPKKTHLHLECFHGYRIDQTRNAICEMAINFMFDHVFFVDSDIVLPTNTLVKLLEHEQDIISGVYIRKTPNECTPEIFIEKDGKSEHIHPVHLYGNDIFEIVGCGFGCALVSTDVIKEIGYPQFEYRLAQKWEDTISEDIDFCIKAKDKGYKIYCDPTIKCKHKGLIDFGLI